MFSANTTQVAATAANYIEDVFSTWLYTGNGTAQTITNNIALSTNGGMVWIKSRSDVSNHAIYDTSRGALYDIASNTTSGQTLQATGLTAFGTTGFTIGALAKINTSSSTYVSWTFRKQAKFFDVVTYTGTGSATTIAHNLGSVPGCIMIKRTDTTTNWAVYHRSLANTQYLILNTTAGAATGTTYWNSTTPTSTVFSLGTSGDVNASGGTYVAYLFAHNAAGFGSAGTDNVISCGLAQTTSTDAVVNLGWEPQFVLYKASSTAGAWRMFDNMRGIPTGGNDAQLIPNSSNAEDVTSNFIDLSATGFTLNVAAENPNQDFVYIAIRRGPMKTPTVGTSVFSPITSSTSGQVNTTNFPVDAQIWAMRGGGVRISLVVDRLRGVGTGGSTNDGVFLSTSLTDAELGTGSNTSRSWNNTGFQTPGYAGSTPEIFWNFGRAPGFFDEVCYTGTGANTTQTHNLGVVPELIIVKSRSGATAWQVYSSVLANTEYLVLNTNAAKATGATRWNSTTPTSTVFSLGTASEVNTSSATYVAYLFATVSGVSKVGSYTGTGALQTVNCGFTTGARFVLIKRTDSTGDWYVWDSARGITSGNDPYLLLDSSAAEVTGTNYVDTDATGFKVTAAAPADLNASGGTYIFLAIA